MKLFLKNFEELKNEEYHNPAGIAFLKKTKTTLFNENSNFDQ